MSRDDTTIIYRLAPMRDYLTAETEERDYLVAGSDGSVWRRVAEVATGYRQGYRQVNVRVRAPEGSGLAWTVKRVAIHRLVLETFVGPCPEGMECRHLDGDGSNNRLENLRWGTALENAEDKRRHGTHPRGERTHNAILVSEDIPLILVLFAQGWTKLQIARAFGVGKDQIKKILQGKAWSHVSGIRRDPKGR